MLTRPGSRWAFRELERGGPSPPSGYPARRSVSAFEARDINDDGWIVGNGLRNGKKRGFVLVPIDAGEFSIHPSLFSARKHQRGIGVLRLASPAPRDLWIPITTDHPFVRAKDDHVQ